MTIAQILALYPPWRLSVRRAVGRQCPAWACLFFVAASFTSCSTWEVDDLPAHRLSPYSIQHPMVWGVAPLRNESGVSVVDELRLTDMLINELQQFPGLNVLPTNRSIAAMSALELRSIDTPEQAQRLAQAMDVDALLVGTITAYDPYDPPVLGMNLALFAASSPANLSPLCP